jgi:hypothetical protein
MVGKENCAYILIKELHKDMEHFIQTGKTDFAELHVFSKEYEISLMNEWDSRNFKYNITAIKLITWRAL